MERVILHCDCNSFYASCETAINPTLAHVPMAVGGDKESRHGIILAKNDLAKKYNVQTAEAIWQAKSKCPDLVIVPPHMKLYKEYSEKVNQIYLRYTDQVEPYGIDESWLDVTGSQKLFGSGEEIADQLRQTVKDELGITISVGVSYNKVFAKLGSDYKKPDATTIFTKDSLKTMIHPLPVCELLFVGKATAKKLKSVGIDTIGDLANTNQLSVEKLLGKNGTQLWQYANGLDNSPVTVWNSNTPVKSIGNGFTFKRNLVGKEDIHGGVALLSDLVATRMRKANLKCETLQVSIRCENFTDITRQQPMPTPTNLSHHLSTQAMDIICKHWNMSKPVRMLTITAKNLVDPQGEQISLFQTVENVQKREKLERTVDSVREKYGFNAVSFGRNYAVNNLEKDEKIIADKDN